MPRSPEDSRSSHAAAEAAERGSVTSAAGQAPGGVLVTGAAGGLGRSVVAHLVAAGRPVVAVGRGEAALRELAQRHPPGTVVPRAADLAEPAAVEALFAEAAGVGITGVAHLAGGFRHAALADMDDADWSFLWRTNVETTFQVCRQASRAFRRAGGGALVAVASPAALGGEAGVGAYAATKAAVLRLVESLAREMAPFGGRANAVLPGTMDTPANRRAMPDADPARWVGTGAVAEVVAYLLGDAASAVNGAAVRVPGPDL